MFASNSIDGNSEIKQDVRKYIALLDDLDIPHKEVDIDDETSVRTCIMEALAEVYKRR